MDDYCSYQVVSIVWSTCLFVEDGTVFHINQQYWSPSSVSVYVCLKTIIFTPSIHKVLRINIVLLRTCYLSWRRNSARCVVNLFQPSFVTLGVTWHWSLFTCHVAFKFASLFVWIRFSFNMSVSLWKTRLFARNMVNALCYFHQFPRKCKPDDTMIKPVK